MIELLKARSRLRDVCLPCDLSINGNNLHRCKLCYLLGRQTEEELDFTYISICLKELSMVGSKQ